MCTCRCGHRAYAGYVAEADSLSARSGWLAARIAAGDPAPAPELHQQYRIWSPPGPAHPVTGGDRSLPRDTIQQPPPTALAAQPTGVGPSGTPSAQTVLLAVGALLLVIAGAVFAAVVWDRLGALGQVALMLVATFGVGALAIRLRRGLTGTAESLAAVAAGLAAVDVMAAPLLGLLPSRWVNDPTLYPAVALGALGVALLLLHRRFGLRAWSWLGWLGLLVGAWCVVPAVATATDAMDSEAWVFAAVAVPTLASVGMLMAGQHARHLVDQSAALVTVGAFGLATGALATTVGVLSSATNRNGALLTTALTAGAFGIWAVRDRGRSQWANLGATALAGITVALLLSMPPDPQPVWLAGAVALAGLVVGLVTWLVAADRTLVATGALAVWIPWAVVRMSAAPDAGADDLVASQLSWLSLLVAIVAFILAWWTPGLGWAGALLAMIAMSLAPVTWADPLETFTLPFAALLLGAGLLWRRRGPTPSLQWLGPAVATALLPSAAATWLAPWAVDVWSETTTTHLVRLAAVLVGGVIAVVLGARHHLAGLFVPGAIALVIAAGAQLWSGLETLPRWVGLAIAGTLLVVAGARIEWLRREGRRAAAWVGDLR